MEKNEKGFGIVEGAVALLIVGLLGFVSWYFWHAKQKTGQRSSSTTQAQPVNTNSAAPTNQKEEAKVQQTENTTPTSTPSQQTPSTAPSAQQPAASVSRMGSAYGIYRIASDGNSAQISPVTTTLSDVSSVELTIDLQCLGACQFKLVSDTYSLSNTATYTSTQKIKYTITKPGEYIFYNQFTSNSKFKIKF